MIHVRPARPPVRSSPRILLLALLPIGDTLFTTPTIRALRQRHPHARITALTHAGTAPLLRCVPAIDDVVALPFGPDWSGVGPLLRALRLLRARRYDIAIDFTTPAYKWVSFACGIPVRTYMKFAPLWWLTPGDHRRWRSTHATRHYYDCARELDLPPWDLVDHRPSIQLPLEARDEARRFLARHGVASDRGGGVGEGPLVGIHPGSSGLGGLKSWPPERFAALADLLRDRWDARIVLLGGPKERPLSATVAAAMRGRPLVATGALPLTASIALIEACDLFIGDDSGPLHAAAAVGTPYVGIFGPTSPANFRPIAARPGQGELVRPAVPCGAPQHFVGGDPIWRRPCCEGVCAALASVPVEAVLARAESLLGQGSAPADAGSTLITLPLGVDHARRHTRYG